MPETPNDAGTSKPVSGRTPELLETRNLAKFVLHDKREVLAVLRKLQESVSLITVFFDSGRELLLTAVIDVDNENLVLDFGADSHTNRKALAADRLDCVASQEKVRIQFELGRLTEVTVAGRPAFRTATPTSILRLQRRDFFRLAMPITRPLRCTIPMADDEGNPQAIMTNVVDLSGGGLAMTVPQGVAFEAGMELRDCAIDLPEVGTVTMNLAVRNLFEVELRNGIRVTRAGCEFIKPSGTAQALIQRYIMKVERERKARESGLT